MKSWATARLYLQGVNFGKHMLLREGGKDAEQASVVSNAEGLERRFGFLGNGFLLGLLGLGNGWVN